LKKKNVIATKKKKKIKNDEEGDPVRPELQGTGGRAEGMRQRREAHAEVPGVEGVYDAADDERRGDLEAVHSSADVPARRLQLAVKPDRRVHLLLGPRRQRPPGRVEQAPGGRGRREGRVPRSDRLQEERGGLRRHDQADPAAVQPPNPSAGRGRRVPLGHDVRPQVQLRRAPVGQHRAALEVPREHRVRLRLPGRAVLVRDPSAGAGARAAHHGAPPRARADLRRLRGEGARAAVRAGLEARAGPAGELQLQGTEAPPATGVGTHRILTEAPNCLSSFTLISLI
jgi:hypothetical protein